MQIIAPTNNIGAMCRDIDIDSYMISKSDVFRFLCLFSNQELSACMLLILGGSFIFRLHCMAEA